MTNERQVNKPRTHSPKFPDDPWDYSHLAYALKVVLQFVYDKFMLHTTSNLCDVKIIAWDSNFRVQHKIWAPRRPSSW